jgi:hypothetical protein
MENETQEQDDVVQVEQKSALHTVTPLSKYLALTLFIIMPFLGGWIGYTYAPEKVVEVERVVIKEVIVEKEIEVSTQPDVPALQDQEEYVSSNGFSISIPEGAATSEEPAQFSYSPITRIEGDFGSLCVSSGYGCGGVGMQGWTESLDVLTTLNGTEMSFRVWKRDGDVHMTLLSFQPSPLGFSEDAQIQLNTTADQLELSKLMLKSIVFTK